MIFISYIKITSKHFQQRMSWLPQRWRTQRNAIRHANCKIQWVIKILNAPCTSLWGVCLLECLFIPTIFIYLLYRRKIASVLCFTAHAPRWHIPSRSPVLFWRRRIDATSCSSELHSRVVTLFSRRKSIRVWQSDRTSNQARIPAEFKHIIKRRKRN